MAETLGNGVGYVVRSYSTRGERAGVFTSVPSVPGRRRPQGWALIPHTAACQADRQSRSLCLLKKRSGKKLPRLVTGSVIGYL